jgi:hypothetical protein
LYGNGIDALVLSLENYREALQKAGEIRDSSKGFFKTYTWTVERRITIRKYLTQSKVDGVMVNLNGFFKKPVRRSLKICEKESLKLAGRSGLNNEINKQFNVRP